jgi:hypothetical protein
MRGRLRKAGKTADHEGHEVITPEEYTGGHR